MNSSKVTGEEIVIAKKITNEDAAFLLAIKMLKEKNLSAHVSNAARVIKITARTASKWSRSLEDRELVTRYWFKNKLCHIITETGEAAFTSWSRAGEGKWAREMFDKEFPPQIEALLEKRRKQNQHLKVDKKTRR